MEYLSTKYGLVTDNDPVTENGQLFLAELIQLTSSSTQNYLIPTYNLLMQMQLNASKVKDGLYNRNPDLTDRRIMSHDNMQGIMAWSYSQNTYHRFQIWKYMWMHGFTYDNSQGKSSQLSRFLPFNPAYVFMWGLMAESKLIYIFLPILYPIFLVSLMMACNTKHEDSGGKILYWLGLTALRDNFLIKIPLRYFEKKMKHSYGEDYVKELMRIYHGRNNSKDFPIKKILDLS